MEPCPFLWAQDLAMISRNFTYNEIIKTQPNYHIRWNIELPFLLKTSNKPHHFGFLEAVNKRGVHQVCMLILKKQIICTAISNSRNFKKNVPVQSSSENVTCWQAQGYPSGTWRDWIMLFWDVKQPLLLLALVLRCTMFDLSSWSGSFEPRLTCGCVLVKHKFFLYRGLT